MNTVERLQCRTVMFAVGTEVSVGPTDHIDMNEYMIEWSRDMNEYMVRYRNNTAILKSALV